MRVRADQTVFARLTSRRHRPFAVFIAVACTGLGLGMAPATSAGATAAAPATRSTRPITPATGLPAGVTPKVPAGLTHTSAPAGAHLTYYGGKVISNVQVTQVLYGTGTYTSEVTDTSTTDGTSIASFYTGVTNSTYFDWLSEYNTTINAANGQPGTQQTIGRGSFARQVQITPASGNNGTTVDDTNIQAELKSQITRGVLPMPTGNTLFALHFRANQTITQGGSASGVQFCAYHGTVAASGSIPEFYYSVLPDFTTGGMTSGCGNGTRYQNETSVSSHEMIEAVTDAEVGLATTSAPPLAWYDNTNGEIGDICNAQQATVTGGDGRSYTVQQEFSNRQNNCVVSGPATTNDFSISVSPTSVSVNAGSAGTATVSTAVTAGSAGSVSLSTSGLPSGATASFSPTSVTAGGSSTLTLSTTSSTPAGTYPITITGVEGSKTHTTSVSLVVSGGGGGGGGLTNGGFETGTLSGWTSTGSTSVTSGGAQSGTYSARVGATTPTGDSSISQTFTVPTGGTGITFWYNVICPDSVTYDWATATLKDNTTGVTTTPLAKTCVNPSSGWKQVTAAATAGHSVTLTLSSHDDNYAGDPTYTQYDSVAVTTSGGGGGGITNSGFETGTFSGWTTSGAATSVVTTTPHTGTYDGRDGTTTATNGDSNIVQTFTVPTGASTLHFWYKMTCPDTLTYDWATATLKNNGTGTTSTPLARTCATNAWTQVNAAVVAGTSYTLTLTSHDDNYAADPSFTLFDDVTVS
jgi:hypothetical protein